DPSHLQIIETKFRKSRLVPLHPTTAQQLRHYEERRKRLGYNALSDSLFISENGKALDHTSVWLSFRRLTRRLGILPRNGSRNPCLQCLRHYADSRTMPTRIAATASANGMRSDYSA